MKRALAQALQTSRWLDATPPSESQRRELANLFRHRVPRNLEGIRALAQEYPGFDAPIETTDMGAEKLEIALHVNNPAPAERQSIEKLAGNQHEVSTRAVAKEVTDRASVNPTTRREMGEEVVSR